LADKYEFEIRAKDLATQNLEKINGRLKNIDRTMIDSAKTVAKWGAAFGAAALFAGNKLANMASDANESINAVSVVFGEASDNIIKFSETAARQVGLSAQEFRQLSTETGTLLKQTGIPMGQVSDQTIELTKRAADLASVFNTDVDQALSAINQAIRGETEAIRKYGADVTDNTLKQYLLAKGIEKSITEMSQQEKTLYRVQAIMEQTDQVTGDFQNTIDGVANSQRVATSLARDYGAELGGYFLEAKKRAIILMVKFIDTLKDIVDKTKEVIGWFREHEHITIGLSAAIGTGLVVALGLLTKAIIVSVIPALVSMATAFAPFLIAGAVIAGVVAGASYLYDNWERIWGAIKDITIAMIEGIKEAVLSMVTWITDKIDAIFAKLKAARDAVVNLGGKAADAAKGIAESVGGKVKDVIGFADGGIAPGMFGAYGIAQAGSNILGMVGEGRYNEAIVPLPNGRSIPVDLRGAGTTVNISFAGANIGSRQDADYFASAIEQNLIRALQKQRIGSS
jgi:predicted anti-sigma-YlaC factor YlaD